MHHTCTTKHQMHHQIYIYVKLCTMYTCMYKIHTYITHAPHAPPIIYTIKYRINLTHTCTRYTHMYHTCTTCTIHRHAPLNIKCITKYICKVMHHVHMYVQNTGTCTTHASHAPPIIYTTKYRINITHTYST